MSQPVKVLPPFRIRSLILLTDPNAWHPLRASPGGLDSEVLASVRYFPEQGRELWLVVQMVFTDGHLHTLPHLLYNIHGPVVPRLLTQ